MDAETPMKADHGIEPFDGEALRRDLGALARAHAREPARFRAAALSRIREAFLEARARIRRNVEAAISPGLAAARSLAALQDETVRTLHLLATRHFLQTRTSDAGSFAIVAAGGYGRGLLAPHSDIDLLFLLPTEQARASSDAIELVVQMLWDLGLKIGHAVRSKAECLQLAREDMTIRTSLLEARLLCGDAALFDAWRREFWNELGEEKAQEFIEAKLAERDTRHLRQGESRYLVEPNIKDGKGGLRDLQTLYWMGKYLYRVEDAEDLIGHGVFTKEEFKTFQKAEAFLWDVRCNLHYLAGRAEERISFDVQPELARRMGYEDKEPHLAVERFMRSYFLVAKDVGDLTRIFCAALEEQNRKRRPVLAAMLPGFLKLRSGAEDFFVENGRLAARAEIFRDDPINLLRLFYIADAKRIDIHPPTLQTVTRSLDLIDDTVRHDREANRIFLEILASRRDPERGLRRMNEAGVLGRFLPEFGRVVALMQFNMYHHYTVDEHSLHAVGNLASIERGELRTDHPLASEIIKRVKSRAVLYLAMLLHDVAKGLPGDHCETGAVMAEAVCKRLALTPVETADVCWLVRTHLLMSDTAQKRDVSDPQTVQNFVRIVQTPERLRLLLLLTVADIRAVGPGVWNGWKGQLLRDLYAEAAILIGGGTESSSRRGRVQEAKEALGQRLGDWPGDARERSLARHSDAYWLAFDAETHEQHARLMADADAKSEPMAMAARSNAFQSVSEIVIYASDHPGLFSQLAGAISLSGGSIVDAKIFTTSDGYALDVFSVQDAEGGPFGDAGRLERLKRAIAKTLAGELLPRTVFAKRLPKKRTAAFKVRSRVLFDNEASQISTVVEVEGADRPGLLYDVTRALFESGLSITSAIVATYGERAVDVFYVRDSYGHKVTHPERLAAVEARLLAALEGQLDVAAPDRA